MRAAALRMGLLGAAMVCGTNFVVAAELRPSLSGSIVTAPKISRIATPAVGRRPLRIRVVGYRTGRAGVVRRTIGMPCVLPPDVIVQRSWNGPQCRWIDNVIPGDGRIRVRRVAYWR